MGSLERRSRNVLLGAGMAFLASDQPTSIEQVKPVPESAVHYIEAIPTNEVVPTEFEVMPGITLTTSGLSVTVHYDQAQLHLPSDETVTLGIANTNFQGEQQVSFTADHKPSVNSNNLEALSQQEAKSAYGLHALILDIQLVKNAKTGEVLEQFSNVHITLSQGAGIVQDKILHIKQEPVVLQVGDVVIGSDRTEASTSTAAKEFFQQVTEYVHTLNNYMTNTPVHFVSFIDMPVTPDQELLCKSYPDQRELLCVTDNISDPVMGMSNIIHESTHVIYGQLSPADKVVVDQAYATYLRVAGVDTAVVSGQLKVKQAERNPVLEVFDESTVYQLPTEHHLIGHPYENPTELLASLVATVTTKPMSVEALLQALPEQQSSVLREQVLKPCLQIFGESNGPQLIGSGYHTFVHP